MQNQIRYLLNEITDNLGAEVSSSQLEHYDCNLNNLSRWESEELLDNLLTIANDCD